MICIGITEKQGFYPGSGRIGLTALLLQTSGCPEPSISAEAVDLTKLVPAEPSSAPQPTEDTGAGDAATASDTATL